MDLINRGDSRKNECVNAYIRAGWTLFPCGAGADGKAPLHAGWRQAAYSPELTGESLPDMFGVNLNEQTVVLDYDVRRDVNRTQLARLWSDLALPPTNTFVVNTASGGKHIYFKKPENVKVRRRLPGYEAFGLKSNGGYVIGAGSKRPSGEIYSIETGAPDQIEEMPTALLELAMRPDVAGVHAPAVELDDDITRECFKDRLLSAPPAISGQGGDDQTYVIACEGRDLGLGENAVFELMQVHYNPRCQPPWDIGELETKVRNAFRYAQNPQGCRNPQVVFAGMQADAAERVNNSAFSLVTARDLLQMHFTEQRWAVKPILPEGLTVIAGAPKIGKSWLALNVACAIANGGTALGSFATTQGEAIYFALEDNQRRIRERLDKLRAAGVAVDSENLLVSCSLPAFNAGGLQEIENGLEEHPECRLVIIDTLQKFAPPPRGTRNAYENDYAYLAKLQELALRRRTAIIGMTHMRKREAANDPFEQVMGSTGVTGVADTVWLLKRVRGGLSGRLTITGRDVEERELSAEFNSEACQWSVGGGQSCALATGVERLAIIELLESSNQPMTPKMVAQRLGRDENNVKALLSKMYRQGQISKESRGKYTAIARRSGDTDYQTVEIATDSIF